MATVVAVYDSSRIVLQTKTTVCMVYVIDLHDFVRLVSNSTYSNYHHTRSYLTDEGSRPNVIFLNTVHAVNCWELFHYYPVAVCTDRSLRIQINSYLGTYK